MALCNLCVPPFISKGLKRENPKNGNVLGKTCEENVLIDTDDIAKIGLYQTGAQKKGHQTSAKDAIKKLTEKRTLGSNTLNAFLINQHLFDWDPIVQLWKTKRIIFSTLYCHPIGHLFVRELFWDGLIFNHRVRPFTEFGPDDYFAILNRKHK